MVWRQGGVCTRMRKRILSIVLVFLLSVCFCGCTDETPSTPAKSSTFSILFIDVGQGDAALVECDGRYMLIDGGDTSAEDKVYEVLEQKGIQHLDILAISHLHSDHIGGLSKALTYASKIDLTISNSDSDKRNREAFRNLEQELGINGATIKVPHTGDKFNLGSAEIEVVDVASENENDSLVLLMEKRNFYLLAISRRMHRLGYQISTRIMMINHLRLI